MEFTIVKYCFEVRVLRKSKVALNSLAQSNGMLPFISAALSKIPIDNKAVFALSPQSPLGSKLMGNEIGFSFEINGTRYLVENIV